MTVHVVGNLCLDTTLHLARFPAPGETLVASGIRTGLGGKGINQAVAAARAGASVRFQAAVGTADHETVLRRLATEERLRPSLARFDAPSDTSTILVRPDGENIIVSACGCAAAFDPAAGAGFAEAIAPGDIVLMQGNLTAAATAACFAIARARAAMTVLNPSPLWDDAAPVWPDLDWLVVNGGELRALSGAADPIDGAATLLARGVGALAVTQGGDGAFVLDRADCYAVRAPAVTVRDTSGAGDVFCGVFVALLANGAAIGTALARATAAASLSVTRAGALASCPTAAELAALPVPPCLRSPR